MRAVVEGPAKGLAAEAEIHRRRQVGEGVLAGELELGGDGLGDVRRQLAVDRGEAEVVVVLAGGVDRVDALR